MPTTKKQPLAIYLAHLEFVCGEYEKSFYMCIPAKSIQGAEKRLDRYLREFYWDTNVENDGTTYYFFGGEIAVTWREIEQLPSSPSEAYERLVNIFSINHFSLKTIKQIKKTPSSERTVREEYALAKHEKRQPRCVYCKAPLEIEQRVLHYIEWSWNEKKKCYERCDVEGDADKPRCYNCHVTDRDFVDENFVRY